VARAAVRGRLTWQIAKVADIVDETAKVRTLVLDVPDWAGHVAGQHLDVRLTAEDGYRAERSYSIATAPGEPVAITVERLDDGEVSPYLTEELRDGDALELRGPIGGYFVWNATDVGPLLLVAGGSGIVPLRAILRHRQRTGSDVPCGCSRPLARRRDLSTSSTLRCRGRGRQTLTREQPDGWTGYARRVTPRCSVVMAGQAGATRLRVRPDDFVELVPPAWSCSAIRQRASRPNALEQQEDADEYTRRKRNRRPATRRLRKRDDDAASVWATAATSVRSPSCRVRVPGTSCARRLSVLMVLVSARRHLRRPERPLRSSLLEAKPFVRATGTPTGTSSLGSSGSISTAGSPSCRS
jgi:hypothetical protein